ncbi:hypothetical protein UFOVP240_221 [uncultured Caudovirales phage]|uniref:Uncharacterized protein n=1 Tax=uncultured Caudovirales phage TaxID=2100421 RepID=A0A6J7WY28_9CAUD|nr:hypothetical protein UFOVP240_221 [uncultured Caudovirales phage]
MQAILEQQRSNVIQFPTNRAAGGGDGTGSLIPVIRELISSINNLTGVMVGQTKGGKIGSSSTNESLNSSLETEVETGRYQETQLDLLKKIEANTRGGQVHPDGKPKVTEDDSSGGLGLLGTSLAVTAGVIAGLVTAWAKTVKFFVTGIGTGIEKTVVFLSKWFPSLREALFNIETTFVLLVESIKGIFNTATAKIAEVFTNLVGKMVKVFEGAVEFFKGIFGEGTGIGKVIAAIKTSVTNFLAPIAESFTSMVEYSGKVITAIRTSVGAFMSSISEGFAVMGEASGPISKAISFVKSSIAGVMEFFGGFGTFFAEIGGKMELFSKLFGAVSKVVSKIAYPLMVVMAVWDTIKGAMAGWEEGGLVGAIGGAIKGLFNSLIGGVLDMIKGAISWIAGALGFTAVEDFLDSFSFEDLFSDFVDAVLFIPKKIQEFIMSPIETLKKLGESMMSLWEPIKNIMGALVDAYLWLPRQLFGLINDYIVTPLTDVFKPLTDFFKGLAEKIMGVFEDFGIPEMGFSILGKKFSVGPWYPFRPDEGTVRVGSDTQIDQKSTSGGDAGDSTTFKKNIVSSGSGGVDEDAMRANGMSEEAIAKAKERNVDKTRVLTTSEKVVNGQAAFKEDFATFDPKTGKAMLSGDSAATGVTTDAQGNKSTNGTREISKRAFDQIKSNAQAGGDNSKIAEIVKEDDAYQKLSWFDKRKVDVGYAKASDLLAVSQPDQAEAVTKKSSDAASLKENINKASGNTNVVNSPLTTYNNQKVTNVKAPIRNQESSIGEWLKSKYQ